MSTESDLSQRVFEPSPNHQIPLKGLRPPGPGVLPFSWSCLAKSTSILISAGLGPKAVFVQVNPVWVVLGCLVGSIQPCPAIKSELISSQCGPANTANGHHSALWALSASTFPLNTLCWHIFSHTLLFTLRHAEHWVKIKKLGVSVNRGIAHGGT